MSNGNKSFTYVQNVSSVDTQDLNIGQLTVSDAAVTSKLVIPLVVGNPQGLGISGVNGQLLLDPTAGDLYVYFNNQWNSVSI